MGKRVTASGQKSLQKSDSNKNETRSEKDSYTGKYIERGRIFAGKSYISVEMASQLGARFLFSDITITHEEVSSTIDSRRRQMRAMMTEDLCSNIIYKIRSLVTIQVFHRVKL